MKHNRALVSKTDVQDIRRRYFVDTKNGRPEPTLGDDTLEWLVIEQEEAPISSTEKKAIIDKLVTQEEKDQAEIDITNFYDDKTEHSEPVFSKINGKYDIKYIKVAGAIPEFDGGD